MERILGDACIDHYDFIKEIELCSSKRQDWSPCTSFYNQAKKKKIKTEYLNIYNSMIYLNTMNESFGDCVFCPN